MHDIDAGSCDITGLNIAPCGGYLCKPSWVDRSILMFIDDSTMDSLLRIHHIILLYHHRHSAGSIMIPNLVLVSPSIALL